MLCRELCYIFLQLWGANATEIFLLFVKNSNEIDWVPEIIKTTLIVKLNYIVLKIPHELLPNMERGLKFKGKMRIRKRPTLPVIHSMPQFPHFPLT